MKKLLLTLAAACTVTAAQAAVADLTKVWNASVENAYASDAKEWNAPIAVDADGNMIATGAFSKDITIAGSSLEAIGSSAYVVKYDNAGAAAWAIAFTGAATVTAIDIDADGNIYSAGTFADEVAFGTTSGTPIVKEGMKVEGEPTAKQNAAFIAKYDATGALQSIRTFVPEIQPDLVPLLGVYNEDSANYFYSDGDVEFNISDLSVANGKVYASAIFSGVTAVDNVKFDAGYVTYYGFMYQDNDKGAVFTLNAADLADCEVLALVGDASSNGDYASNLNAVSSIKVDVNGQNMFVSAFGTGNLKFNDTDIAAKEIPGEHGTDQAYVLINTLFKNGVQSAQSVAETNADSSDNAITFVKCNSDNAVVVGKSGKTEIKVEGEGDEQVKTAVTQKNIFVDVIALDAELTTNNKTNDALVNELYFNHITSASVLASGEVYINTLGYTVKGVFAEVCKSFVFANDAFSDATTVADAVGVASAGSYVAFSQIGETGAAFSLYNDSKSTGIEDIVVDENAKAEYFNLQGVRVDNPENGLYIVRQGNKVTKQLIRK